MRIKYTKELIEGICKDSYSYRQCLCKLGLKEAGGNYACLKSKIQQYGVDISHFTHQATNKGKRFGPKRPIEDYLSNKHKIQSYTLKRRLLKEDFFEHKCYNCQARTWLDNEIPLELHHINGDHQDNSLENLTLLCPNCHSMTNNYRGKNKK